MQNAKRKRHLTAVVAVFISLIAVGGVFAAVAGVLDIVGTVRIGAQDVEVIWTAASHNPTLTVGTDNVTTGTPGIVAVTAGDRPTGVTNFDAQRINWTLTFQNAGTIVLTATATNEGVLAANILGSTASWNGMLGGVPVTDWGITVSTLETAFIGPIPPQATRTVQVLVDWDGNVPTGAAPNSGDLFTGEFTLAFQYEAQ